MDKKTAIEKIRKCLALAKSQEPHEAAAAMRQAQSLMRTFGIEHPEMVAAGIEESWAKSAATSRPPRYEVGLASVIAEAFGCELLFSKRVNDSHTKIVGGYVFIGVAPASEVAQYTFAVLARQLRAARADYIVTRLKRCGQKNKIARADVFCLGWVTAVRRLVDKKVTDQGELALIAAYMRANYATTVELRDVERLPTKRVDSSEDRYRGYEAGSSVRIRDAVAGDQRQLALPYECASDDMQACGGL
ncbi:DUF2786 domain-containing protein [Burkholderia vietnamiensis]|uniref:DUF2786 domain-containing protein n=1 Tax=Burkholderia vietnamiensis TaxID=60552 RepID=UPI00075EC7EA|nr:DUF2786 domain-containing protein [Burkholderia vietnamiensis]KVR89530.1 hypothetical protein WK28_24275 [Burkholderia vietnamiensis]